MSALGRGSVPFQALSRIQVLGGKATTAQLMRVMPGAFNSITRMDREALRPLVAAGLAVSVKAGLRITRKGIAHLEAHPDPAAVPVTASFIDHAPMRPLSTAFQCRAPQREGSMDYRSIPSVMAGKRIAYHGADGESN
jgi:hypothetical protein